MDPKEVKQLLKDAKQALQGNDNQAAAKAYKTILRKEPGNYNANLLLGTAFRQQDKFQQALEYYKKSIEIDPAQIYGWQGVILVHEKQNNRNHPDLLDAFKRLATDFEKDDKTKYIENTLKLANILISQQDGTKALKVIARLAKSVGVNLEISQILVQLFNATTFETRTKDEDDLYTSALETLIDESPQPAEETYRKYFSQLFRSKQYGKLALRCTGMQQLWNHYYSPMEWICRLYLENRIEQAQLTSAGGIEKITDRLFKLHPSSRYGYFARGKFLIQEACKYVEGFSWIKNALESSFNMHAALVLVRGKLKFGDYEGAMEDIKKALANCKDDKLAEKGEFEELFELLHLEGLVGTNEIEQAEQQRVKLEAMFLETPNHPHVTSFLDVSIRILFKKKELTQLANLVSQIEAAASLDGVPVWRLDFYKAILESTKNKEKFSTFISSCIQTHDNFPDLMLESGIFLYDHEDYESAAEILANLASTVEGKNHPHTWKYLGQLAHLKGDDEKAAKYLKKSYDLNLDSDVGALLCDIYQELGDVASKKTLLTDALNKVRKTKSKWVWARLGLIQLEEGNLIEAVESLQSAIRVDLEDGHLWESLADAYFYRGSLQASLRCYKKALEHGLDSVYPLMRISAIHQFLEEEDKSISSLKELLVAHPTNATLYLELARLYLWVATEKVKENFDKGAASSAENGLECAVKAILYSEKTLLLPWMIIGDFSVTLGDLPEETRLTIPSLLVHNSTIKDHSSFPEKLQSEEIDLKKFKEIGTKVLLQCL